jgi:hypothetical protein
MHSQLADVFALLDRSREVLRNAVARIPAPLRHQRPAPERWSPVEVIEHLALTDRRFTRIIGDKIRTAVAGGLGAESSTRDALPTQIASRLADRTAPRPAPEDLHPSGALDEGQAWEAADTARAGLRDAVLHGDTLALSTVVHEHGAFGPLTVYQWIEFLAGHELRHVEQIREAHDLPA